MEIKIKNELADCIRIYIPASRRRVAEASIDLAKARSLAGGWSISYINGGWIDPTGKAVEEPVDEHEFLVPHDKAQPVRKYLIALAEDLLRSGEQAVLVVVNHYNGTCITYTIT